MAGDWMKVEKTTPDKPEIDAISAALGIDPDAAFGKCFRVWRWFDDHTTDGNAPSVTANAIDRRAGVPGFADAMAAVGWLVSTESGVSLPKFDRHNGETSKARALTAKRVASCKTKSNAKGNAPTVTSPLPNALPREEKRREEENTKKEEPPTPKGDGRKQPAAVELPANLQTPDFRAAWDRWQQHRREKKSPLTPTSTRQQLKQMTAWGPARSIEAIDNSILNGWTGLFEPKDSTDAKHNGRSREQTRYASSIDALARFAAAEDDPEGLCESPGPPVRLEENNGLH